MKRLTKKSSGSRVISAALTWDGARWPVKSLPPKARAFLRDNPAPAGAGEIQNLFATNQIKEIRICWVPRLKGGGPVLSEPFPLEKRIAFAMTKTIRFGDLLGVVYRRNTGIPASPRPVAPLQ